MIAPRIFMTWHRRLSLIAALALFFWAISGVSHPIMSRLQPTPINKAPPHIMQMGRQDVSALLPSLEGASDVRAVGINDELWWRRERDGAVSYLRFNEYEADTDIEAKHAEFLARFYTGEQSAKTTRIELIREFSDEYPWVNRVLPVWAVRFDRNDGLTAYVDTKTEKLSLLADDTKVAFSTFFRIAHSFRFLEQWPLLRITIMLTLIAITLIAAIMGIVLWWRLRDSAAQRLQHKPLRRWHRRFGFILSWALLAFASSAFWHAWHNFDSRAQAASAFVATPIAQHTQLFLPDHSSNQMQLLEQNGQLWWRTPPMKKTRNNATTDHHHHDNGELKDTALALWNDGLSGEFSDTAETQYRDALLRQMTTHNVSAYASVTDFGGEYGFVNKRLPVYRATLANDDRLYFDPATGAQAALISNADAAEGFVFHYLHKWNWLPVGKNLRDLISALLAFALAALAVVGVTLYWRQSATTRS